MNVDEILFRCSGLHHIMSDGKDAITPKQLETIAELQAKIKRTEKQEEELSRLIKKRDTKQLAAGVITHLRHVVRGNKWKRRKIVMTKFLEKGIRQEEEAITILSLHLNTMFLKNTERLSNRYITGEPDLFKGQTIRNAEKGWDTKVSWDIFTFPFADDELDPTYWWQNHGYMALTGAREWETVYCLVNAPASQIVNEKKKLFYAYEMPESPEDRFYDRYKNDCILLEESMIFDLPRFMEENPVFDFDMNLPSNPKDWELNIPSSKRVIRKTVQRDPLVIKRIYDRVEECRTYIKENLMDLV